MSGLAVQRPSTGRSSMTATHTPFDRDATTPMSSQPQLTQATDTRSSKEADLKRAYSTYAKVLGGGSFATIVLIFAIFSIFWGALFKIPVRNLHGWLIDFDEGTVGQQVIQGLTSPAATASSRIAWDVVSASQFVDDEQIRQQVLEEKTWVALIINAGTSSRLQASLTSPNASYDGSEAITVFASEARNENAFRSLIRPSVQGSLDMIAKNAALGIAKQVASSANIGTLLSTSPQTLTQPVYYQLVNLLPFDQTLATAVTFVGLIYQVILAFFIVNIAMAARQASGIERMVPLRRLVILRLGSSFGAYFIISLFYCLLSVAFQLNMNKKFGHAGFMVFWMLNYVGMLALGLALEAMVTLLTMRFIAFFMLTWIITNASVVAFPIEVLATVYRYGYAAPFYSLSKAMRTIIFGTKNELGLRFGILLIWVAISCITLPLFMLVRTRLDQKQAQNANPEERWEEEKKEAAMTQATD